MEEQGIINEFAYAAMPMELRVAMLEKALADVTDGMKEHDIAGETGLPPQRVAQIYALSRVVAAKVNR